MKAVKKLGALLLAVVLFTAFVPSALAGGAYLEDIIETKNLVKGVSYRHIKRLYENGWQDIHIVRADLTEPHLAFQVLRSEKGVSYLESTLASAKNHDTVAAINADFFASKRGESGKGSPVGMEVIGGELHSTASTAESMNVLYQLKEDLTLHLNSFTFDITVTAPDGVSEKVVALNKYHDLDGLVMYTDRWNTLSLGASGAVQEIIVNAEGEVVDKRWDSEPCEIPEGGFVLTSNLTKNTFIDDHLQVGDKVELAVSTTPDYEKIENAVGGGGIVLANGVPQTSFSHNITGYHPRSIVGIDESGEVITLVAVDGRRSDAKGMSQKQLGELMLDLGCYHAMNFDGGGSTLLAIKEDGEQTVANQPSDGANRAVTNSVGIVSSLTPTGKPASLVLSTEDTKVFRNTSRAMNVKAYDENDLFCEIDAEKVKWSVERGSGSVKNGVFYPTSTGTAVLRASYQGIDEEIELTVLDSPKRMQFATQKQTSKSGKIISPVLYGWDEEGKKAKISISDTDFVIEEPIAERNGDTVKALSKGATIMTANFGAASASMALMIDGAEEISVPTGKASPDSQNRTEELNEGGFQFTVFGNTRTPETLFDLFLMNRASAAMAKASDLHAFVGSEFDENSISNLGEEYFTARSYQSFTHKNSTFITLDNGNGTIADGGASQWVKFREDVAGAKGDNIFVFLTKPGISTNETEKKFFDEILSEAASKGKNVYVFGGGFKNENYLENGIRYVNTAGVFPSIGLKPPATNISYVKYLLVTVNGDEVTYDWKKILE
ncbi:MAG: phosphodiester glycosidase family protein [Clostridia bacterium]|nr:phosphodiester glycosidase family protein [Clostridia bacterium]